MCDCFLRICLIGCYGISNAHIKGYLANRDCKIVSIVELKEEVAKAKAEELEATWYTDYRQMFEMEDLNGISICTPPVSHKKIAIEALQKNIHVLCEKPLAMTAMDAEDMVGVARRSGALLITGFCHRFYGPVMKVKEMIKQRRLGRVLMFRNIFASKSNMKEHWFSKEEISGGGTLMDTAVHSVDLFRYLVGDIKRVVSLTKTFTQGLQVEDSAIMLIESINGEIGTIEASWSTPPAATGILEIYGSEGMAIVNYDNNELHYDTWNKSERIKLDEEFHDRFQLEINHFIDCIAGRSKPIVNGSDGVRALEVIEAAYRSSQIYVIAAQV